MQNNKDTITSVAQDAKQGIPHVEGRKRQNPGKPLVAARNTGSVRFSRLQLLSESRRKRAKG